MNFLRKRSKGNTSEFDSQSSSHTKFIATCIKKVTNSLKCVTEQKKITIETEEGVNLQREELDLPLKVKTHSNFPKNNCLGEVSLVQVLFPSSQESENGNKGEKEEQNLQLKILPGMTRDSPSSTSPPASKIITNVHFNNNGNYLAASFSDFIIRVWGVKSNRNSINDNQVDKNDIDFIRIRNSTLQYYEKNIQKTLFFNYTDNTDSLHINNEPHRIWKGHKSSIIQFCWSSNDFCASYSDNNIVNIWHLDRNECICCLSHVSTNITSITFHPSDDRYLLVTSSDKKIRLWSLDESKVLAWNQTSTHGISTAVSFTPDASMCAVGTSEGEVVFYELPSLKYHTQISSAKKSSSKTRVNGIQHIKSSWDDEHRLLITTTDSNIKMYNICDKSLYMNFRGFQCSESPITAITYMDSFVLAPSEDKHVYFWDATPLELLHHSIKTFPPLDEHNSSIKKLSGLKISKLVQIQKLNSAYGLMNWVRFRLPRCTDSGIPSISIAPLFRFNDPDVLENPYKNNKNIANYPTKYSNNPFIFAVGVNDVVYIYINQ